MDDVSRLGSRSLSSGRPDQPALTRCPRVRFVSADHGVGLSALQSQARKILSSAKYEAQIVLDSAKARAAQELELARKEGFNTGVRMLTKELLAAHELRRGALASAERKILELALSLARAVVGEELSLNPESLLSRVERALSKIRAEGSLVLSIHPEMEQLVKARLSELLNQAQNRVEISIRLDPALAPSDALIESSGASVYAGVEEHFRALAEHLLDAKQTLDKHLSPWVKSL